MALVHVLSESWRERTEGTRWRHSTFCRESFGNILYPHTNIIQELHRARWQLYAHLSRHKSNKLHNGHAHTPVYNNSITEVTWILCVHSTHYNNRRYPATKTTSCLRASLLTNQHSNSENSLFAFTCLHSCFSFPPSYSVYLSLQDKPSATIVTGLFILEK